MPEDDMFGWHHELNRHKSEQAPGVCDGQGGLDWCSPWGHKDLDMNEWLNWTELEYLTLGLSCLGLPGFLGLGSLFPFPFYGSFQLLSPQVFSQALSFCFFSGTPKIQMFQPLILCQKSLRLHSFLFILFPFFHSFSFISTFIFLLTYPFFCLSYSAVDPSKMFLISIIILFIVDWLFFISSRSELNIYCIFSIHVSSLFISNSILFSNFNHLYYHYSELLFSRLFISPSFVWFGEFFIIFLHLLDISLPFHVVSLLCLGSPVLRLESHGSNLIVESAPCGWSWTGVLWRLPGWGNLGLVHGTWSHFCGSQCSVQ